MDVTSPDGTTIHALERGDGPNLILVHGIGGAASRWMSSGLATHYHLYGLDRRGRGGSLDHGKPYAIAREVEDICAVLEKLGPKDTFLLGHSFGGALALEAANLVQPKKLLVYEPFAPLEPLTETSEATKSYEAMIDRPDLLLERFLREIVQMPESDLDIFKASTAWKARVAAATTIPRELGAVEKHTPSLDRLAASQIPVRFFLGEKSPPFMKDSTERLHRMVPQSDLVILPGQAHVAMDSAPALFESEVRSFFG